MPAIRIFLLTYRRPHLLPRALASLRAQTFTDWTCELHNDAPDDESPRRLLQETADPRITLHQHEKNWGAVTTFNHAYAGGPEPFLAILEDDNWWEPTFLATAHAALVATPAANVAWSNLRLWQETADGHWTDTQRTVWKTRPTDLSPRLYHWPQPLQLTDALHSHGAMLCRAPASAAACVPPSTPLAIIEPVRERLLAGGWLFLPQPLANFALTLRTARSDDRAHWAQCQLLVAASFIAAVPPDTTTLRAIWSTLRAQRPPSTPLLFQLAFAGISTGPLLRHATLLDGFRFLRGTLRHPLTFFRALRFRRDHAALWETLRSAALARSAEAAQRPLTENSPPPLLTKSLIT